MRRIKPAVQVLTGLATLLALSWLASVGPADPISGLGHPPQQTAR